MADTQPPYDAFLLVSFGGPEGPSDVMPFLENVLRGRHVPHARMLEVAEHYYHFGGISPINAQNRQLLECVQRELSAPFPNLRCYWGNRNWHPMLLDTLRQMERDGVRRALAFMTSAFSSYSGCRQYREDIEWALAQLSGHDLVVDKIRVFYNHPGFLVPMAERLKTCLAERHAGDRPRVLFTAHSIPRSMADSCDYQAQLLDACQQVAAAAGTADWELVFQSRSGPPQQPWLEPDVCDRIRTLAQHEGGAGDHLFVVPIGFVSDHLEILYDLDTEAAELCRELGIRMTRVPTVGTHPRFVQMIRELVEERMIPGTERLFQGSRGPKCDVCPADCCPAPAPRPAGSA